MNTRAQSFALFSLLALFGLQAVSPAQDWQDQGSIRSRQYKNEIRGDRGVEATEFFTLQYQVSIQIVDAGQDGDWLFCTNACLGAKHKEHAACDLSCDDKCPEKEHKHTRKGEYLPDRAAMAAATAAANALAIKGGGTVSPNDWSHRVSSALAAFARECKKKKTWTMPHQTDPCSGRDWLVGVKIKEFKVRGTMTKSGFRMSRGVRTPISEVVGTHEQTVATGKIPQDDPLEQDDWTICNCKLDFDEIKKELAALLQDLTPSEIEDFKLLLADPSGFAWFVGGEYIPLIREALEILLTPKDMNTIGCEFKNKTDKEIRVAIPPGTLFMPEDAAYQIMAALVLAEFTIPPMSTVEAQIPVGPAPQPEEYQASGALRWACMQMAKKEPRPGVKYKMKGNRDEALTQLAAITNRSRFRGPHDQARIWIYTDKASMETINKRMIPGVSHGRYAMLLRDVGTVGGVDFSERGYSDCLMPDILAGVCVDESALRWLVSELADVKGRDLARYVNGSANALAELTSKDAEDGPAHVAWIADAMLREESLDLRKAAVKLLLAVPAAQRAAVAREGGLEGLRWLLMSGNAEQCALALSVCEAYPADASKEMLMASLEAMPSAALTQRAEKVCGVTLPAPAEPPPG